MKLPRTVSGADVIRALEMVGFQVLRQAGSHVRLGRGAVRVTVPLHTTVAPGTLRSILRQAQISVDEFTAALL
ncbi:MAG: type II toxin-antitoxin system HicA family toxin [Bryobacteraceae bacterium]|nr:type II toxin-antitoxin system HicA family toxin [Bryobacteraceae bacterium]